MWHFGIWFSWHGGVGQMVGLDDLRGLFQPMILWFYDSMILWFYDSMILWFYDSVILFRSKPWTKRARLLWSPSFKLSMTYMAWNTSLATTGSPVLSASPCKYDPFTTPHLRDVKGLSVILAAIIITKNWGLFLHSFPTTSSVKL